MLCDIRVGGAAVGVGEVDGYWWKVERIGGGCCFLVCSCANGCVRGLWREKSLEYAGGVFVREFS